MLRGVWMLLDSRLSAALYTRVLPHVIDSVLLASALWLAATSQQYPFVHAWLTAKVVALVAYIALGRVALRGMNKRVRFVAWLGALTIFAYILTVARTRSPLGFLVWL